MAFRLVVARGNHSGQQFIAVQPSVGVGRESGNDLILSDAGISARHAQLVEREGRVFLSDLGTANGTWLNGERIAGESQLKTGDAIAIGTAVVQFAGELDTTKKPAPKGVPTVARSAMPREVDSEKTAPMGPSLLAREEDTGSAGRALMSDERAGAPGSPGATVRALALVPTTDRMAPAVEAPARDTTARDRPVAQACGRAALEAAAPAPTRSEAAPPSAPARDVPGVPEVSRMTRDEPTDPSAAATSLAPNLPAAAEALTTAAPVLVPAAEALRRPPDVTAAAATVVKNDAPAMTPKDETAPRGGSLFEAPESAADRARKRRAAQATLAGQLGYLWSELSLRARLTLAALLLSVMCVLGVGLVQLFHPPTSHPLPPEPEGLSSTPIAYSFGLGDVDYEHPDFKELRFDVAAPMAVAVLLHYAARDIAPDEVSIAVNGTEVGFVPADVGLPDRELEAVLSPFALKRNASNVVVFDNVKNPPGHERWRISHLWMELIPVPETNREAALGMSRAALGRGAALEEQHAAGDDLLFRAWRAYREGWFALLALRDEDRGPLFVELKRRSDALRFALDTQCGTLMLDAKKQMELKNPDAAREILQGVPRFFPTRDHPCHALAEEKLTEYEL